MFTVTSILGQENHVVIPSALFERWGLQDTTRLYASVQGQSLRITKEKRLNTTVLTLYPCDKTACLLEGFVHEFGHGFSLPDYLVESLKIREKSGVSITLKDGVATLSRSSAIDVFSPERSAVTLADRLRQEFDEANKKSSASAHCPFFEDVYMFLLLGKWDTETTHALLSESQPIASLLSRLRSDEEFNDFFDKKLLEFLGEYSVEEY